MCILIGVLAGGGSLAVAVGVTAMWQVTGDTQHMTHDNCHLIKKKKELVLPSAHVERFSASLMHNFFLNAFRNGSLIVSRFMRFSCVTQNLFRFCHKNGSMGLNPRTLLTFVGEIFKLKQDAFSRFLNLCLRYTKIFRTVIMYSL